MALSKRNKGNNNNSKNRTNNSESRTSRKGGVNQPIIIFFGLLFLLGSVIIYLYIIRGVFGRFTAEELIPDSELVESVVLGGKPDIGILYSEYTENMLPEGSTWLNDNITTWRKFLDNIHLGYQVISDKDIEKGNHFKYDLLVLPGSKSLSDREVINIKKYINNGGSVFATSGIASYSDDGKWRGWEFFSQVFGVEFSYDIENDDFTKIHTLRGGLPITANIPTGFPLQVATWDRPIAVEVLDPRTKQVSFWYNYRLQGGLVREGIKESAGIVYGTYGKGRFVWMGFEINSVIGVQEDYVYFDKLFNNCINWLNYSPIAFIRDWPDGYDAAAIIAPSLNEDVNNINNLLPVLSSEEVPATFFVAPSIAEQNQGLINKISGYGEIAALVDIGYLSSVDDTVNNLDSYDIQLEKLKNAKSTLESISNSQVIGALPYYGLFDQNTIKALIEADYKYVVTDSLTDRSVPRTIIRGDNRLISITKTARDDYEVIRDFGLTLNDFQLYTYQEDIDRILFEGGLYVMKMHTEYQCQDEYVGVIKDLITDLKSKNYWITTASDIEKWYSKRNYIELRIDRRGNRRVAVTVSNPGEKTIDDLIINVEMNDDAENITLSKEIIGTKSAQFRYDTEKNMVYLYIDDLQGGESRTYYIDYDKPSA